MRLRGGCAPLSPVDKTPCDMVVQLANVLLRQAANTTNSRQYLTDILTSKFGAINTQSGQIVATTVNGKSMTLQTIPGMNLGQFLAATELALSTLESGLQRVGRSTWNVAR